MATIRQRAKPAPISITKFLGLNESQDGETELQLGEASEMRNFRITDGYGLKKMEGYGKLFDAIGHPIRGMWYGKIAGAYHFLFACNGHVYEWDAEAGEYTSIGNLTDGRTTFFAMNEKVYILNGHEYKYWNGTTFGTVSGYVPLIFINAPPAGGGTAYEGINLLIGKKHMTFSGDGTSDTFQLVETGVTSVDSVYVDGALKSVTTHYTVNLTNGTVTFTSGNIPADVEGNVDIYWTKGTGQRSDVESCRFAMFFGGQNDSRIHLWGNDSHRNRVIYSGLVDGLPSAEYFPATNYNDVGSNEFAITDIVRQYNRQVIFTERGAYYAQYSTLIDDLGNTIAEFPVLPISGVKGSVAPGTAQIINNNPVTIYSDGVYQWSSTSVIDERAYSSISRRVQTSLDEVDVSGAVTIDWEKPGEYWLCVGDECWIWSYRTNTWFRRTNVAATCFIEVEGSLYFGDAEGCIHKFSDNYLDDNGDTISAEWKMGFYDWGKEYLQKYLSKTWVSMKPEARSKVLAVWEKDNGDMLDAVEYGYNLLSYDYVDYGEWTYRCSANPSAQRRKTKMKKFGYARLVLRNDSYHRAHVLAINMLARTGGEIK